MHARGNASKHKKEPVTEMDVLESVIRRESKRSSNRILNEHFRLVTAGLWNTTTNRRFTLEVINI